MPEVGLYNVEVLVHLKYSLIVMMTCSVGAEIASVLKTLNTCIHIHVFLDLQSAVFHIGICHRYKWSYLSPLPHANLISVYFSQHNPYILVSFPCTIFLALTDTCSRPGACTLIKVQYH